MKALASIALGLLAVACVETVETTSIFDPSEAEFILRPGSNTITGQAFLRQAGGQVVTCAGSEVTLIPNTRYAEERMINIYGSFYEPRRRKPYVVPDDADIRYSELTRKTICNAQGDFKFTDVPDGRYFITTAVIWRVSRTSQAGGSMMSPVQVTGGETAELLISP